jgi:pseudouridine-5'-monophosphatase
LYTITIQQIANQYGGKIFTWEMKSRLMGMMGREAAVAIVDTLDLPIEPEEYMTSSQKIMAQMFPSCKFLPGQLRKEKGT